MFRWENDGSQKREAHASAARLQAWYQRLPGRVAELLRRRPRRGAADAAALPEGADAEEAALLGTVG